MTYGGVSSRPAYSMKRYEFNLRHIEMVEKGHRSVIAENVGKIYVTH